MIKLGLIGFPLEHSRSPAIHQLALQACGLHGIYTLYPISPNDHEAIDILLDKVRAGKIHGLNITIPHKQTVISKMDQLTQTARAIGAVNTVYSREGILIGDNTDAIGFQIDLDHFLSTFSAKSQGTPDQALIIGGGGSAHAIAYSLLHHGWRVAVATRREDQGEALCEKIQSGDSKPFALSLQAQSLQPIIPSLDLVVNTTPVGMFPNTEVSPWPGRLSFPTGAAVYDIIYNPRETKLVRDARNAGLPAKTGLGMLVEQAAASFNIWTGANLSREFISSTLAHVEQQILEEK